MDTAKLLELLREEQRLNLRNGFGFVVACAHKPSWQASVVQALPSLQAAASVAAHGS